MTQRAVSSRVAPCASYTTRRAPLSSGAPTERTEAGVRIDAPARAVASSNTRSNRSRSTCHPIASPPNACAVGVAPPHSTVLPVARTKPAPSTAALMPIRSNSLRQLGGSDSARTLRAGPRASTVTDRPHAVSSRAATAPAGPPPITTASVVEASFMRSF